LALFKPDCPGQGVGLEEDQQTQQKRHEAKETTCCIDWEGSYNSAYLENYLRLPNKPGDS